MTTDVHVVLGLPIYQAMPVQALGPLLGIVATANAITEITIQSGPLIAEVRNEIAAKALEHYNEGRATHLWMIDADTALPTDALHRLVTHAKAGHRVVAGLLFDRQRRPVVYSWPPFRQLATEELDAGLQRVQAAGTGCIMIELKLLVDMASFFGDCAWFQTPVSVSAEGQTMLTGEDFFFYERLEKMGVPAMLDAGLRCGHVKTVCIEG